MDTQANDSDVIRVIVCDDHPTTVTGVAAGLMTEPDIVVIGTASDAEQALKLVKKQLPDIILLDIFLRNTNGIDAIRRIRTASPSTQVVMFTMSDESEYLVKAAKAGATGYIMKDKDAVEITMILRDVHHGHYSLPISLASDFLQEVDEEPDLITGLSDQERDILKGLARNETYARLAKRLMISERTVGRRLKDIRTKLSP